MNQAVIILFGTLFSYTDLKRHVIPNRFLALMLLVILFKIIFTHELQQHLVFGLSAISALTIFQWISGGVVGMGDIKYLALLSLLIGSFTVFVKGLEYSFIAASIMALVVFIHTSSIKASIPLAPPISLGFLLALII